MKSNKIKSKIKSKIKWLSGIITLKLNWNRDISSNCSVSQENMRKSDQILWRSAKITTKFEKIELFSMSNFENAKKFDENLLKYWGLSGAKACKSCRSRQELFSLSPCPFSQYSFRTDSYSNEYLLAKFGFDTAENEPLKVWFNFHIFTPPRDLIFT